MLTALNIRDIVLIDRLDLEFGGGLSVMTGETGAGKSILLDAFALALGARGDAALVRKDIDQGQVTAVFAAGRDHPVNILLEENGIAIEDELILRRIQSSDGRTRAFINDEPVSVQLLKRVGAALVEIHGQHDDRALTDAATHRLLLDAFAGLTRDADALVEVHEVWMDTRRQLQHKQAQIAAVRENADYLTHALDELKSLDPKVDEEETLAQRRQLMMHAEKIARDLEEARDALGGDGTAHARLGAALRKLERQGPETEEVLRPITAALERVLNEINEARERIDQALVATQFEPKALEEAEERLFALRALARKHKVAVADLPDVIAKFERELAALDVGEQELENLKKAETQAREAYRAAALALSEKRHEAADRLDQSVMAELPPLKLEKASFKTDVNTCEPEEGGPSGLDRVAFQVQTNPGTEPGPMMKVASGGELARFILALKVVLAARGSAPTLIFDEIDTGVGGATAAAIGERLAKLSDGLQVVAVTHAPQVAAHASGHLRISKEAVAGDRTEAVATRVITLDEPSRREEIARMLAGQTVTDEARAAADRLIGGAR
ncbi:MAG: DNA repair protein RecN [Hyphomicrobiaceae bacterium]|nr:DNA repair protein RecN [Hyphomicrobiaceae bacterium]